MSDARSEILSRVRDALADVDPAALPVESPPGAAPTDVLTRFAERVADYRAEVVRCSPDEVAARVADSLVEGSRVVVPPGLDVDVANAFVDEGLSAAELDRVDAVVTACRLGIAETGTIVLDHEADQGRRAITLVPDRHICVVRAEQVVADVPDAMPRLDPGRPLTWISGPSATSDIELERVEGVHGPRTLIVVLVDGNQSTSTSVGDRDGS
ncbi:LutC/YkgG family protein [Solicola gregarius]|uniref:LUD domain-containing protein n=1 Tax=Solicola gregarius TaxID=2908642 RepID=A0AA46TDN5_9ACTN|nr:LUD domain-containing protein [Solicola gregarius]UYM03352.1 LUD domain-containing protein [Solicola gregarius]